MAWRDEPTGPPPRVPSPASVSAPHAWLNRVTQEEEERKRRGLEEEEEGRKGAGSTEEKEDEGRGKKDMQEKLNKLFSQPADPWGSAGLYSHLILQMNKMRSKWRDFTRVMGNNLNYCDQ